jgi:hypothetical protein
MNDDLAKLNAQILLDPAGGHVASYLVPALALERLLEEKRGAYGALSQLFAFLPNMAIRYQFAAEDFQTLLAIASELRHCGFDLDIAPLMRGNLQSGENALRVYSKGSAPKASQHDKESAKPPPPEVANRVIDPVPPEVREHFLRTFDEAKYLAEIRELERTGGVDIDDLIAELERRADGST